MPQKPCAFCGRMRETTESMCLRCARPAASYPNIDDAQAEEEVLQTRYRGVLQPFHTNSLIAKFQTLVKEKSRAVMTRWVQEVYRIALDDYELLQPETKRVHAGVKGYRRDEKWDRWRSVAAAVLFPGYEDQMHFAALSLDRRGLIRYGNCRLIFYTEMIAHRSTIFERNSAAWARDEDAHVNAAGLRSTWSQRDLVVFAKLAHAITSDEDLDRLPRQILIDEPPDEGDDQVVEVHIWGPLIASTCEEIDISPAAHEALRKNVKDRLDEVGVKYGEE